MKISLLYSRIPILLILASLLMVPIQGKEAKGIVFEDTNKNLERDVGERGVPGVLVSNGLDVVQTDSAGRYNLEVEEEAVLFITKPSDYDLPLNEKNLPLFYYIHRPKGSPPSRYKGVDPTGPLPAEIDFPLFKSGESYAFDVIVLADPQPYNLEEIDYIRDDVIAELVGSNAAFGLTLGDIVSNDLSLFGAYNEAAARAGIPFYNVPGNHDTNQDAPDDRHSLETYIRHFGPPYYSFDHGRVHFVVLDDVEWHGKTRERKRGWYRGKVGEKQIQWLANDLEFVDREKLVVLSKHIPVKMVRRSNVPYYIKDVAELFRILEGRKRILFLAGHTHTLEHHFLGKEDGWNGAIPIHQLTCGTVSGCWWGGPKDIRGIPVADMGDGSPNGYHVFRFVGNQYTETFKPAAFGRDHQLRISSPRGMIQREDLEMMQIVANVFDGSEKSLVECIVDNLPASPMTRQFMKDPFIENLYKEYEESFKSWVSPRTSQHIWTAPLPRDLKPGHHTITLQTRDQFGRSYQSSRIFALEE